MTKVRFLANPAVDYVVTLAHDKILTGVVVLDGIGFFCVCRHSLARIIRLESGESIIRQNPLSFRTASLFWNPHVIRSPEAIRSFQHLR
jgi:hypothetical protein